LGRLRFIGNGKAFKKGKRREKTNTRRKIRRGKRRGRKDLEKPRKLRR